MQSQPPANDNVVLMPLPYIDEDFWSSIPSGDHPRAAALKARCRRWLTEAVIPHLNRTEAALATFVLLETVGSGRAQFTAKYRDIQDFIWTNYDHFGLTSSRKALSRAVTSLMCRGLLIYHHYSRNGITLSLDLQWVPDE